MARGDTVVVGVSGGADSMALLRVLQQARDDLGIRLVVAHINHGLRPEAGRDERHVETFCEQLQIPYRSRRVKVASGPGASVEERAREARFRALMVIAKAERAQVIALAHHQDDQAETVVMRLLRGSGLMGLQAIVPRRVQDGIAIVRPFLAVTRAEIMRFVQREKIDFCIDATNEDRRFFRNAVRHDVLPFLRQYNPQISKNLARLAATTAQDYAVLEDEARRRLEACCTVRSRPGMVTIDHAIFQGYHPAFRAMVMRLAIERCQGSLRRIEARHIDQILAVLDQPPGRGSVITLPGGMSVRCRRGRVTISRRSLRA